MCPEIPYWFVLLATYGAISLVAFPGFWLLHYLAELWIQKDEPITHVGQIKRRIFS